jgi:hypothetical protein
MNIVEYFVRRHLRNKLNDTIERLAVLDELISHWMGWHSSGKPNTLPAYIVSDLAKWKSERAGLKVRKANLEKELKVENKTQHEL